jgi:hypothetical protein
MVLGRASGRVGEFGQSIRQSWRTTITSVRGMYFHFSAVLYNLL